MVEKGERGADDPIFSTQECRFNRLALDQLKKHELRVLFETLMSEPANRTIADINALIKIMLTLQPIKKLGNSSTVYHICRSMFLAKFREKSFVYQRQQDAESLYIILNGKVGLYKRTPDQEEQEEVVFLSEGSSFGRAYRWKQKFLPLTFEETLLAVVPKRELTKIAAIVEQERQQVVEALDKSKIFGDLQELKEVEKMLTLHRVPFGSYMIKEGQIPKGIFFLLKGSASQRLQVRGSQGDRQQLTITHYSAGDCFPKESLSECLPFSIVAESPCEIVSVPKKCLRALGCDRKGLTFKGEDFYRDQMYKQGEWEEFKTNYLASTIRNPRSIPKPMIF